MKRPGFPAAICLAAALVLSIRADAQSTKAPVLDKAGVEKIVHDYLLAHPEILAEMSDRLQSKQAADDKKARTDALAKIGTGALVDPKVAYVTGPANAKVTVAEFFDYRCPHCKASLSAIKAMLNAHKNDVRFAFLEFPILTPDSVLAAKAAVAARRQPGKYLPFHLALMSTAGALPKDRILAIAKSVGLDTVKLAKDMDDPEVLASLKASSALADTLHFDGTPTFVINDKIVVGEITQDELASLIKDAEG